MRDVKVNKMHRLFSICLPVVIVLTIIPMRLSAQVVELCEGASTAVMGGEYNVMNNVWGATTPQCLEVNLDSTYFKVSLSGHNNGSSVAAYPSIFKGCHWGWCTTKDNPMPVQVRKIESAPFTWVVNTDSASVTWNAALDIWFGQTGSGSVYSAEMMIWLDYHGGASPAGSKKATVVIGGLTWDLYFAILGQNYIAYKITSPVDSVNLDLRDFIDDAITRGYLYTPWYMHDIEAGFEIFSGGQGLTTYSFAADVGETATPVNYAPSSFRLQSPADGSAVDSMIVPFKWQKSVDPDLESVEYIVHLLGPASDTTIAGLDTNNFVFIGSKYLQPNTSYTWYVEATDKVDTTISTTQRTFSTPEALGVDFFGQLPDEFFLYQNYPNPFNPSTKISYTLKNSGTVRLSVYDLLGREVAVLANGAQRAGIHEAAFSGAGLASGLYFYRLQTTDEVITKKMTLMK